MSMTAPLRLAVTPRVNESRLSVSRRAVLGRSAGMVLSHEVGKSTKQCVFTRIIFDAGLYHTNRV